MARIFISILCFSFIIAGSFAHNGQAEVKSAINQTPGCETCVTFGKYVQREMAQNKMDQFLENFCKGKTGLLGKFCSAVISRTEEFIAGIDVQKDCDKLLMCNVWTNVAKKIAEDFEGGMREAEQIVKKIQSEIAAKLRSFAPFKVFIPQVCNLCKAIVDTIDKDTLPVEKDAIAFVDKICHRLPPPADMACVNNLNAFINKYWKFIFADPKKACDILHLCP